MELKPRIYRKKDYFWIDNDFIGSYSNWLGTVCISIYLCLARHADNKTQTCFPSQETIGYEIGVDGRTVRNHIKKLIKCNIVAIKKTKRGGRWLNHTYLLCDKTTWTKPPENVSYGIHRKTLPNAAENINQTDRKDIPTNNTHNNNIIEAKNRCADTVYRNRPRSP